MSTAQPPSAPRRLLFRLLPGVVLAALLPFVGLIAVAISTVYDDTRREIDSRLEQAITQAARPLEAHLTDAIDRLSTATEADTAPTSTAEGQAWLDAHPDLRGVFDNLVVVSASGIVLADAPALPQQRGTDMAWHPIFKAVRESRRLQIPEPFLSSAGQRPVASFAAPLHGPDGGFSGLVIGSIELARNPILADVENTRIGRTGHLLVVSERGRYIVGPDHARLLQQAPDLADGQPAARARAQGWNDSTEIHRPGQSPVIVSYRALNAVPWSIGAWWPAQEAYAGAARTTRTLVAAGLAFGAACLLFAWFWLERATSPLERLRHEVDAGMPIHTPPAPSAGQS